MLMKYAGGGVCTLIAVGYFVMNQFASDEDFPVFTHGGQQYLLSVTSHPDRTKFVTLYDEAFDAYATTSWFRPKGELTIDCPRPDDCIVLTQGGEDGPAKGFRLSIDVATADPLTDAEWYSERTFGFEPYEEGAAVMVEAKEPVSMLR